MNCQPYREAISALVDGEEPGVALELLEGHLRACAGCQQWDAAIRSLSPSSTGGPTDLVPDLSRAILARTAVASPPQPARPRSARLNWLRAGLALVATLQMIPAVAALTSEVAGGTARHLANEVGSLDIALAVGFLYAAWRPARAWGMLPLVSAVVASLLATAGIDVAGGRAGALFEAGHALELSGLGLLWGLARTSRRPSSAPAGRQPAPGHRLSLVGGRAAGAPKAPPATGLRRGAA